VVFLAPQVIGLLAFIAAPMGFALALAFVSWDGLGPMTFVGFDNFTAQVRDPLFLRSVLNTLGLAAVTVPVGISLAVLVAVALDRIRFRQVYRVIYFAPVVTSSVAVAVVWQFLLGSDGVVDGALKAVGWDQPPQWLADPRFALLAVCIVTIWSSLGLNVIICLAGLQNIPSTVREAARVDGAGPVRTLVSITLPLLSPTIFFLAIVSVISSLQAFDTIFLLTKNAGPDNATRTVVYHVYDLGFRRFEFGASSAAALLLLVLTLIVTLVQFTAQKRFVHYET
jgi:multiple sugar transport system permease protein